MKCNCILCGNEIEVIEKEDKIFMPYIEYNGECSKCNIYVMFKKTKENYD